MEVFMNIRSFGRILLLILISALPLQAKIDPRFLRGAYANLHSQYQKFSLFHGVAAAPKIENQLLYNNDSVMGQLVKQLFHQIQNQLTPPAAFSRPASYLSLYMLGMLIAAAHQNFPQALEAEIKKAVTEAYLDTAQAENKVLNDKNKQAFNKDLAKIFELIKQGLTPQTEYDLYATLITLVYLKAGSVMDLDQYYQGLAYGLNIPAQNLFIQNDMVDDRPFSQQEIIQQFNTLQVTNINEAALQKLAKDSIQFEKSLAAMLLINSGNQSLPKPFDYQGDVFFEAHKYPDCSEATARNILQALLFDSSTGLCSLEKLRDYSINPDTIDAALKAFYQNTIQSGNHTLDPCNPIQAGNIACHNAFSAIISNRDWLSYSNRTEDACYMRLPQSVDYQEFLKASRKPVTVPVTMTHCSEVEVSTGQKITVFQADSAHKLYELTPSLKNFIILFDQLLQLGLFTGEDALEKVFWRDDFETVYFDRLVKLFDWEYTSSKRNFRYNDGMPGAEEEFHIKRSGCYRFYLRFDTCAGQPYHAEYHLEKSESKEKLNKIDILETVHHNRLFFNACATGNIIDAEQIKQLFKSNPEDSRVVDALYFCDLKDLNKRLEVMESILSGKKITSEAISLAQKLFLAQAPREDYSYQNKIIKMFTILFTQHSVNQQTTSLDQFIHNDEIKKLLILIAMLKNSDQLIKLLLSVEATNKQPAPQTKKIDDLCHCIVQRYKQDFVVSFIELLCPYYGINPYLKSLCSSLLAKVTQSQAQQRLLDKLFVLYRRENTDGGNKIEISSVLLQHPHGRELIMRLVQQEYPLTNDYSYHFRLLDALGSLLDNKYSHEKILTFAQDLYHQSNLEKVNKSLFLFKLLVERGFAFSQAMQACIEVIDKKTKGIKIQSVIYILEALIDRKQELDSCFDGATKLLSEGYFNNPLVLSSDIEDSVNNLFQRLLKKEYSDKKVLYFAQSLYDNKDNQLKEKAIPLLLLLVKRGFALSEAASVGMHAIDNQISINAAGNIFKQLCSKEQYQDDCFDAATKLLALNSPMACKIFEFLLENKYPQEKILSFGQALIQNNNYLNQKETINFFEMLIDKNLAFPEAAYVALHAVTNGTSSLDKAIKIFKILIGKKQKLTFCFDAATKLLMLNNSEVCSLFKSLLENGYSQDQFVAFAQALIQNSDTLKQKGAANFFKFLINHDFAFPEAAQVTLYLANNQVHLDTACDLFKALVEKEQEIEKISCIAHKLFKYNPSIIQRMLSKLFKLGHGFLQAAQCLEEDSVDYYLRQSMTTELIKYIKNDKASGTNIESIACMAIESADENQWLGALILLNHLLKENSASDSALLAVEKVIVCSNRKVKKKAFEILCKLYRQNFGYDATKAATEDGDALLSRIASAAHQGIQDIESCAIDYAMIRLFEGLVERGLAYETAIKIVQASIVKEEAKGNAVSLLEALVEAGQYFNEALQMANEVQLKPSENYKKIMLFIALVEHETGIENALNFAAQLASNDSDKNSNLSWVLLLLQALIKKNYGFEIAEQVSCHTLLNCTDFNSICTAYDILKTLLKNDRALASGEKVAIKMTQEHDDDARGRGLQLFQIIVEKSLDYESAFQAAQQELARKEHDKTFDNRSYALDILAELVKQNYQPAFELAFSTAKSLIQDKYWSNRYAARKCFNELVNNGYLNQVKAFLAQFDQEFSNNELQELAQYIKDQSLLGTRSDENYNLRSLPPEPKCQKLDHNSDIESKDDQDIEAMVIE